MHKRTGITLLIVLVLLLVTVVPALAITYGEPDAGQHPYVGLVGFYDAGGNWLWRCSGTLIAPTILLTAGHCTAPDAGDVPARAQVWFDEQVVINPPTGYPVAGGAMGTPIVNPNYAWVFPNTNDVGLVVLDQPITDKGFAVLPPAGFLEGLDKQRGLKDVNFMPVGYGLNEIKPQSISLRIRYKATSHLVNMNGSFLDGNNILTSNNPGSWSKDSLSGGTCFGDSGGPVFYSNTDMVVAVTSFGLNQNCKGVDGAYRLDIDAARSFLGGYITLP